MRQLLPRSLENRRSCATHCPTDFLFLFLRETVGAGAAQLTLSRVQYALAAESFYHLIKSVASLCAIVSRIRQMASGSRRATACLRAALRA